MKKSLRYTFRAIASILLVILLSCVFLLQKKGRAERCCAGLSVEILTSSNLVSEGDVRRIITRGYGAFVGQKIDSVALYRIESLLLDANNAILHCDAYLSAKDSLCIVIEERTPLALIACNGRSECLIDGFAELIPKPEKFVSDLPVVSGDIPITDRNWLEGLVDMLSKIPGTRLYSEGIEGYKVHSRNITIESAQESFILGEPVNIDDKLRRMDNYCTYIRPHAASNKKKYKTVNLSFNRQTVCK